MARHLRFSVKGLSCPSTGIAVEKALCRVPGVVRAAVNYLTNTVYVDYHPEMVDLSPIHIVLQQFGLTVGEVSPG